jgi:hypothetical protein
MSLTLLTDYIIIRFKHQSVKAPKTGCVITVKSRYVFVRIGMFS